jgi:4-amino-4-deoxy-L-arabinose transferase-like glycosyltransferase
MTAPLGQRLWPSVAILFVLWVVVYVPGLFQPSLFDDADAAHAEAAREMLTRHDWVTLHQDGIRYLEKAPLPYWAMAASFRLFGVTEWTARLAQGLSVLALLLVLFQMGRKFLSPEAGFWAAVVTVTSFGPYLFTRILIPDLMVGLWLALGLYFFLLGWQSQQPSRLACWGLAASVAFNVLTKSLIGLFFPCAIILLFLALVGDLRHLRKMRLFSSTLVFLAIATPWHIFAALHNPAAGQSKGFLWFYFVNEQFLRYLGKRYPMDYGKVPLLLFWGLLLVWLLPWSAFLPQALKQIQFRLRGVDDRRNVSQAATLLFFIWGAVILVFFSFSTRQEYYVAPALPSLALLLGAWLDREALMAAEGTLLRSSKISATILLSLGLIISAATLALAILSRTPRLGVDLADLLNKNPDVYVLSLGHFLDLTGDAMGLFRWPLAGTGVAFLLGTGLNWFWRRRSAPGKANWALTLMMCVFIYCAHVALGMFAPVLGSKPLATAILRNIGPGDLIVSDGEYANASSINFYTRKQMLILNGRINGLWYGSLFPDAPQIFLDDAQFAKIWAGNSRVFLVTGSGERRATLEKIAAVYLLARAGGKFVFTNRPARGSVAQPTATKATPAQTSATPVQRATLICSPRIYFAASVPKTYGFSADTGMTRLIGSQERSSSSE